MLSAKDKNNEVHSLKCFAHYMRKLGLHAISYKLIKTKIGLEKKFMMKRSSEAPELPSSLSDYVIL